MVGARVFLPGGRQRIGHGGAVADPGLVIGAGPWEKFGEGARPPRRREGLWWAEVPKFFFAKHASGESLWSEQRRKIYTDRRRFLLDIGAKRWWKIFAIPLKMYKMQCTQFCQLGPKYGNWQSCWVYVHPYAADTFIGPNNSFSLTNDWRLGRGCASQQGIFFSVF